MKFFSTFISVGILVIFGAILGIQLNDNNYEHKTGVINRLSNEVESVKTEHLTPSIDEDETSIEAEQVVAEVHPSSNEKAFLTKVGQGLDHFVSGVAEKAVSKFN